MRPRVVFTFLRYEIKRSVARRKVVALAFFTVLIGTLPYFLVSYVGGGHSTLQQFLAPYFGYLWVVGVFLPQAFFVQFTGILIGGGAMSEEYETGTAELLLSKPVTKAEYFAGKFLGGYVLLAFIIVLNMVLAVISATATFGQQLVLSTLPTVLIAQIFVALLFFTIGFMFGEVMRRSSLSYIIASSIFFTSEAFGLALSVIYSITNTALYQQIQLYLPTSAVGSIPMLLEKSHLPSTVVTLLGFASFGSFVETSLSFSLALVVVYFVAAFVVAFVYFEMSDVSRKVS
ncbi:MAG: ABC transporter permease subunit [Nitrososphaerota archaeon]|nr:ABC transporter permease subunit [Nitrososphaerota archaeon]MDG6923081.1 ABC transporter permease subunit [Nitrososphaerota archaeon]